jgi:hypothetical protein
VVTAHHLGHFYFHLCVPGEGQDETEECFSQGRVLEVWQGAAWTTNYELPDEGQKAYEMTVRIPTDVACAGSR